MFLLALLGCPTEIGLNQQPFDNEPPLCSIVTPLPGATFGEGGEVRITARVEDEDGDDLDVVLESSIDGVIDERVVEANNNFEVTFNPSNGQHDLILTVTDPRDEGDLCVVQISVEPCQDADGDGFENCDGDCDDNVDTVYPDAPEEPDGRDNDCDGTTDEGTALYDDDGDGWSELDGDCDDEDADLNPDATEIPDDGIDQDCNEADTVTCFEDADSDGVGVSNHVLANDGDCFDPGEAPVDGDCDDNDANRYPGANDVPDDGIDQDCDGSDAVGAATELYDGIDNDSNGLCDEGFINAGALVITEMMVDPASNDLTSEWFEVYNTTAVPIHLCLWRIFDTDTPSQSFDVSNPNLVIQPHSYFVFAKSSDTGNNGGLTGVDHVYGTNSVYLSNSAVDGLAINFGVPGSALGVEVDRVVHNGWMASDSGHSYELGIDHYTAIGNDIQGNWCLSTASYGSEGNHGTPGGPPSCTP